MSEILTKSKSGATSSRGPRLDLVPHHALVRLAARYELGAAKHGRDNWRKGLGDIEYLRDRISHAIEHAYKLLDDLDCFERDGTLPSDDNAGALMWGGAFACEGTRALGCTVPSDPTNVVRAKPPSIGWCECVAHNPCANASNLCFTCGKEIKS